MGYTHYFKQKRDFTEAEWGQIKSTYEYICNHLPKHTSTAGGYYKNDPLEIENFGDGFNIICFNGTGPEEKDLGHGGFIIHRFKKDVENCESFCKTARKPYDLVVTTLLLYIKGIAPGAMEIDSDGDMDGEDWAEARDWVKIMVPA